jgi:glyoxylase-like metal-dependent hydrolase (beta-lactamase superfamily II)
VRVVSLHADVLLATSAIWQTSCALVRSGEEVFVVDSPVLPEELDALPSLLAQSGWAEPSGLLVTHGDWDHLLGRLAFPQAALGCAASTARRLGAEPGAAQRELRAFDESHYIVRPQPLSLAAVQALDVPGRCDIGAQELELHPAAGHTADGMAILVAWAGVLVAGDYLSSVEIPMLGEGGDVGAYLDTLQRLRGLLARVERVVPGHGPTLDRSQALAIAEQDARYLDALRESGAAAELPPGRRDPRQREIHAANIRRLAA